MEFFRGIVLRELATVSQLAPFLSADIAPKLKVSAEGAVKSCSGGANGRLCGFRWTEKNSASEETSTFPRQANALSALSVLLADSQKGIATGANAATGGGNNGNGNGNGNGNNAAGNNNNGNNNNNNNGNSAGTTTRATLGLIVLGLFASLL